MVLEKLKKTIPKRHLAPKDLIAFKHDEILCSRIPNRLSGTNKVESEDTS